MAALQYVPLWLGWFELRHPTSSSAVPCASYAGMPLRLPLLSLWMTRPPCPLLPSGPAPASAAPISPLPLLVPPERVTTCPIRGVTDLRNASGSSSFSLSTALAATARGPGGCSRGNGPGPANKRSSSSSGARRVSEGELRVAARVLHRVGVA